MEGSKKTTTRQTILELLKASSQGLSAAELAELLRLTPAAARRHLTRLEGEGLAKLELKRLPLGRPSFIYSLTTKGEETFPRGYDRLLLEILDLVGSWEGGQKLYQLFQRRADGLFLNWRARVYGDSPAEKLARLTELLNEQGYMAHWVRRKEGPAILRLLNCPFLAVARRYDQFCCREEKLWARLLGTDVERLSSLSRGDRACVYQVSGL